MGTHYDTLGVAPTASAGEIRKAYLRRARALHPDRQLGREPADARRAELAMQQVNAAWTVLSNHDKRAAYDEKLRPTVVAEPARTRTQPVAARSVQNPPLRRHADPEPATRTIDEQPGDGSVSIWASIPVLIIVGVLLGIVIVTAFAGSDPTPNRTPAPVTQTELDVDDCFAIVGTIPRVRACGTSTAENVVVELLPDPANCPSDTSGIVDPANGRAICYKPLIPGSAVTAGS